MEAFLCASPAITVAHPVPSPLLARQAGASIAGPRTSLSLPLAAVPAAAAAAASRSRTRRLSSISVSCAPLEGEFTLGFWWEFWKPNMSLLRLAAVRSLSGPRGGSLRARATSEDDSSTSTFGYIGTAPKAGTETVKETAVEKDDAEAPPSVVEDVPAVEQPSSINFLDQLDLQLDSENTYYILIYGTGAFVALWISSAIVGAIDSLPLFPKMMEIIGVGFTVWFTYRYLLFKKNRDELFEKIDHLKEQILGPSVD